MDRVLVNKYGQVCCAECKHPHLDKCWHCGCPAYVAEEEARNRAIEHWDEFIRTGRTMGSDITKQEKRMAFELREGQGTLFENDKKGNERAPDLKGTIMIAGREFGFAAWKRVIKNGNNAGQEMISVQVDTADGSKGEVGTISVEAIKFNLKNGGAKYSLSSHVVDHQPQGDDDIPW